LWDITELRGLGRKMPFTCAAFVIAAISMIGVPPSVGFVSKLYIIFASLEAKKFAFVAILLVSSLLNLVYFWRVIETIYMKGEEGEEHSHASISSKDEIPLSMLIPVLTLASLCIVMGVLWLAEITIPALNKVNAMFGLVVIR
jgi:multicomponent Na+:H+ antiporter subunit D